MMDQLRYATQEGFIMIVETKMLKGKNNDVMQIDLMVSFIRITEQCRGKGSRHRHA